MTNAQYVARRSCSIDPGCVAKLQSLEQNQNCRDRGSVTENTGLAEPYLPSVCCICPKNLRRPVRSSCEKSSLKIARDKIAAKVMIRCGGSYFRDGFMADRFREPGDL